MGQLTFDLGFPPRYGAEDFLVSASNAESHDFLRRWPDWSDHVAILVGPEGAGKTHLGSIWADRASAVHLDGAALSSADPRIAAGGNLLIDDADQLGSAEAILFHIVNLVRGNGTFLLATARQPPNLWELKVPDLLSRLRLAPLLHLQAPDDDLLRAVLVKLCRDRQLVVDESVIDYVALRLERSLGAARRLVEALDRTSLAEGRRITRPVAADVLAAVLDVDDR